MAFRRSWLLGSGTKQGPLSRHEIARGVNAAALASDHRRLHDDASLDVHEIPTRREGPRRGELIRTYNMTRAPLQQ